MQLNYHLYANSTGYSISAQDYVLAMMRVKPDVDIRVHYVNTRLGAGISSNREQLFTALNKKEPHEPNISLFHSIPIRYRRHPGPEKHVGICVYETIDPPQEWISTMNNMDVILTASHFNKNVFENSGVKVPIHVVPHCFDENMFNKDTRCKGRYSQTTFISVGTWKTRKNWKVLIKAWYEAFEARNNVCLLIKTDKPQHLQKEVEHIKRTGDWRSKSTAPIYCEENPVCDFEEIPKILRKGDIYVNCSLGEGFGISGLQAMALGIPVITTRFGGSLEYAKPDLCTYFEPSRYQKISIMDSIPQLANKIWPFLTIKEVAHKMRYVLSKHQESKDKAEKAYKYVHENFNYKTIGKQFLDTLEMT